MALTRKEEEVRYWRGEAQQAQQLAATAAAQREAAMAQVAELQSEKARVSTTKERVEMFFLVSFQVSNS